MAKIIDWKNLHKLEWIGIGDNGLQELREEGIMEASYASKVEPEYIGTIPIRRPGQEKEDLRCIWSCTDTGVRVYYSHLHDPNLFVGGKVTSPLHEFFPFDKISIRKDYAKVLDKEVLEVFRDEIHKRRGVIA